MASHPLTNRNPQRDHLAGSAPKAVPIRTSLGRNPQRFQNPEYGRLEPIEIVAHRESVPSQRNNRVNEQLARGVYQASATTLHPTNFDTLLFQNACLRTDFARRTTPANRNHGRVLTQQQANLAVVALGNMPGDPTLQSHAPIKIDVTQ